MAVGSLLAESTARQYKTMMVEYVPRTPFGRVVQILFLALDNIDVYSRFTFTRTEDGEKVKNHMEHGIVVEEFLVSESIMLQAGPAPAKGQSLWKEGSSWDIMTCLPSIDDINGKLTPVWQDHIVAANTGSALVAALASALYPQSCRSGSCRHTPHFVVPWVA